MGVIGPDGEHGYTDFQLIPDGTRLAALTVDPELNVSRYLINTNLTRDGTSRFTFGPVVVDASAVWSPGGERILFRTQSKGTDRA